MELQAYKAEEDFVRELCDCVVEVVGVGVVGWRGGGWCGGVPAEARVFDVTEGREEADADSGSWLNYLILCYPKRLCKTRAARPSVVGLHCTVPYCTV